MSRPQHPTITCDHCGAKLDPPREIPEKGGIRQELRCHNCGTTYPILRITRRGLALRHRLNQARQAGDETHAQELLDQYQAEITDLRGTS